MSRRRLESLLVLFISIIIVSTASATLLTEGTTQIVGNNPGDGSFKVQIDYAVYDGASATDPLNITTDVAQITFVLTHLGADVEMPALDFGRFTVFAPDPLELTPQFYTGYSVIGTTGVAPRITKLYPPSTPVLTNHAEFIFDNGLSGGYVPQFNPGEVSKILVLKTSLSNLPATILLEIDKTNAGTAVDGDVYITIPEPCSLAIFGGAFLFTLKRFRKK